MPLAPLDEGFLAAHWSKTWFAIAAGLISLALLYVVGVSVSRNYGAAFLAAPFFVGAVVGLLSARRPFSNGLIVLGLGLAGLILAFREGILCVLMSLPLLVPELLLGLLAGALLRRWLVTRRQQGTAALLLLAASAGWQTAAGALDDRTQHPWHVVRTERVVPASPERIWAEFTSGEPLVRTPPALLRLGFPRSGAADFVEARAGGRVELHFNHGTGHARLAAWEPGRRFDLRLEGWDLDDPPFFITRLGQGEHYGFKVERLTDWMTIGDIDHVLEPLPDGSTRVVLITRFQRHLGPDFYFGRLEPYVVGVAQAHLLASIAERAERPLIATR